MPAGQLHDPGYGGFDDTNDPEQEPDPGSYERKIITWDLISIAALAIVSFGVTNRREVFGAVITQFLFWMLSQKGPGAMYSFLAGSQYAKGKFLYATFPTLIDAYQTIDELSGPTIKFISYKAVYKSSAWVLGALLSFYRII